MSDILVLNGPNLNLLGQREPEHYGAQNLDTIINDLKAHAESESLSLNAFQSNAEHELIDAIHQAGADKVSFIIFNPAGFTHTSIALRDALLAVDIPFIELHLSNTFAREEFRHVSFFSDIAQSCLFGFGAHGYELAVIAASRYAEEK